MDSTIGPTVAIIRAISGKDSARATACGKKVRELATNMKESISRTKSTDMAFFHGPLGMSIKATILKIFVMGMGRCIGAMEATTRGSGIKEFSTEKGFFTSLVKT